MSYKFNNWAQRVAASGDAWYICEHMYNLCPILFAIFSGNVLFMNVICITIIINVSNLKGSLF